MDLLRTSTDLKHVRGKCMRELLILLMPQVRKPIIQLWQLVSWCIAKCYPWVNAPKQQWMSVQIFDMWSDMIHWLTVLLLTCNTQNHPKDWPHSWITDETPSWDAWTWPFHSWQSLTPVVPVTLSNGIKGNIFRSELTRHMDDVQLAPVQ